MKHRHVFTTPFRARGAIASKLVILVALGAGAFWSAQFSPRTPATQEQDVAGLAVSTNDAPRLPALGPTTEPPAPSAPAGDPFAGADVDSNPVLRHIARIVEPKRTDPAAQPSTVTARATTAPRAQAAAPRAVPAQVAPAQVAPAPAAPPQAAPAKAAPQQAAPAQVASTQAVPAQVVAAPVATAPASPLPVAPLPAARALAESGKQPVQQEQVPAPAAVATRAPDAERVALARADASPPAPAVSVTPPRTISRSVPQFPAEAIKAGIKTGRVLARVSIDAEGRVVESEILSARPPGYFERESQRALASWRYAPPGRSTSTDVELLFARE